MKSINVIMLSVLFLVSVSCQVNVQNQYREPQKIEQIAEPIIQPKVIKDGYWISVETGMVIEYLTDGNLILNRFGSIDPVLIAPSEFSAKVESTGQLSLTLLNDTEKLFQRPANIDEAQLTGQWFSYINEGEYENSQILTYQIDGYSFESVELFHLDQGYSKFSAFLSYQFSHGFVFEGFSEYGNSQWYFLIESTDDIKTYIDEDGRIKTEERYIDQPHVRVPDHYYDDSF